MEHRIKIQQVDVEFENSVDAFKIRDSLSEVCRNRLLGAMEKLFDKKYRGGPLISISNLFIDAGQLKEDDWEGELVNSVIQKLEAALDKEAAEWENRQNSPLRVNQTTAPENEQDRRCSFLLYYLENGVQPWNSPFDHKKQMRDELLKALCVNHGWQKQLGRPIRQVSAFRDTFAEELIILLASSINAAKRLLYLLPEKDILQFLARNQKSWSRIQLLRMQKAWNRILDKAGLPKAEQSSVFLQAVCASCREKDGRIPLKEVLPRGIMQVLRDRHQAVFLRLPEMLREKIPPVPGKGRLMPQVQELPAPEVPGGLTEEPVYIRNAGLVLLHPFLQYLFENVGYTVKNKWDSQALHQRSVVLTQYLVRGDDEYSEPDLFLNKLLAGFPVEAPLPLDITLSEYEKKEAEELLGSVITHWKALKNTSAQALRETFIQRTGRIIRQDSGWLLTVDQKTQDILLGKLPWGFSLTKTSWMEEIITVDWT